MNPKAFRNTAVIMIVFLFFTGIAMVFVPHHATADNNPSAAPKSACNQAPDVQKCKNDYEHCGSGNSNQVIGCRNRVIGQHLTATLPADNPNQTPQQSIHNISQNGQYSSPGCSGGSCGHQCGADDQNPYTPSIDLGCKGKGNPILDTFFGIIHFLTNGVGIIVVASIVVGGIQYSASRGDPQATALAIGRLRSSVFALMIFIFAYAAINYIIPGAILK